MRTKMFTVGGLIARLQRFDPELPVCLEDWSEEYALPSNKAAQKVRIQEDGTFVGEDRKDEQQGDFVLIGGN